MQKTNEFDLTKFLNYTFLKLVDITGKSIFLIYVSRTKFPKYTKICLSQSEETITT